MWDTLTSPKDQLSRLLLKAATAAGDISIGDHDGYEAGKQADRRAGKQAGCCADPIVVGYIIEEY